MVTDCVQYKSDAGFNLQLFKKIIAIIISSGIFYILDIGQMDNTLAIGWLIRGWGISHLAAAFLALRLPMAFERGDRRS